MDGPLKGIRVIEMSTMIAAPSCGKLLALLGAEVIKVESLDGEPWRGVTDFTNGDPVVFDVLNAGKKSISINAKNPEVANVLKELISTADVFLSNIRTDALARLGLDYESLKVYKRLVYVHFSGYGEKGPLAKLPGYDGTAFFVRNGVYRDFTSPDNEPINHMSAFGDMVAGLSLALNTLAALMERNRSGQGTEVHCALNQIAAWALLMPMVYEQFGSWYQRKERDPTEISTASMLCKDGEYLYYNAGLMKQWHSFCKAIGRGDLVEDERCKSTSALFVNKKSLYKDVSEAILQRSADEWVEILRAADVPCEKHRHLSDMATDEQLIENGFIRKSVYGETSVMVPTPPLAPSLVVDIGSDKGESVGAHTQDILESLGCPTDLINKLVASGDIIVSK